MRLPSRMEPSHARLSASVCPSSRYCHRCVASVPRHPPPRTPPSLLPLRDPDTIQNRDDREHTPLATGQYLTRRSRRSEHLHAGARSPPPPGGTLWPSPGARTAACTRAPREPQTTEHTSASEIHPRSRCRARGARARSRAPPASLGLLHRERCPACKCSPRRPHLACSAASAALARLAMPADLIAMIFAAACGDEGRAPW